MKKKTESETKSASKLHKGLRAAVCEQFVKCGKNGCKCSRGFLHGPYFCCFWRESGKLKKLYVRKADVESVRSICHAKKQQSRMFTKEFDFWRSLQHELRSIEDDVQN